MIVILDTDGASAYACAACQYDNVSRSRLMFELIIVAKMLLNPLIGFFAIGGQSATGVIVS